MFEEISFPEVNDTQAIQLGNVDGDGLLDLLVLNNGKDEIRLPSPYPSGGARLHGGILGFRCPDYMGHPKTELGRELSKCVECTPDHMPQQGTGEQLKVAVADHQCCCYFYGHNCAFTCRHYSSRFFFFWIFL